MITARKFRDIKLAAEMDVQAMIGKFLADWLSDDIRMMQMLIDAEIKNKWENIPKEQKEILMAGKPDTFLRADRKIRTLKGGRNG